MQTVLLNIGVLFFVLAIWTAAGIGLVILLAPKTRFLSWLLLSPLIGLMLIASIGVARLEFFLVPANPLVDCSVLIGLGLAVIYWHRKSVGQRFRKCCRFLFQLSGPYFTFLFLFALVFGSSGFETLSTGSDEVVHGLMEEQVIQNVHRGTPDDNPIMRLDHYVQDYPIKDLVYLKNKRIGSDVLTITTAMLLQVSPERIYPVTFACLTLVLAAGVLFLCRQGFNMKLSRVWPVPLFFLACGGLWTLHIQGNFSNLSSWILFLLTPWFLIQTLGRVRLRWIVPLALMVSSVYSFYYEPALFSLVVPCGLATLYCILGRRTSIVKVAAVMALVSALVVISNPTIRYKIETSIGLIQRYPNFQGSVTKSIIPSASSVTFWFTQAAAAWRKLAHSDWWPYSANVLLGISSGIDVSKLNPLLRNTLLGMPLASLLGTYALMAVACFGLLTGRHPFGWITCAVMLMWFASTHLFVMGQGVNPFAFFSFYRSAMYTLPCLLLGIGLAFCHARTILERSHKAVRYLAVVPLIASAAFLFVNSFTSAALGAYVFSHSICDDRWIRRLNPDAPIWQDLRTALAESRAPVLISGFSEPPRILWLASGIRPLAHFMGKSTSDRWVFGVHQHPDLQFYPTRPITQYDWIRNGFGGWNRKGWYVRMPSRDLIPIVERQNIPWNQVYPRFLAESEISLVPIRHGWPQEWREMQDIFGPVVLEYPNIADVVYRHGAAISTLAGGLGLLSTDERGRYREFTGNMVITAHPRLGWVEVSILHDGTPEDLTVSGQSLTGFKRERTRNGTELTFRSPAPVQSVNLAITGSPGVRIRNISMRVVPATLGCKADKDAL